MGKLTDLLKQTTHQKTDIIVESGFDMKSKSVKKADKLYGEESDKGLIFDISEEDLEKVRSSVVEIDVEGKSRNEIIIGKYGMIVNPKTGRRFVIPSLSYDDPNYVFDYADMMRTLVLEPEMFKKIMRWE